MGKHTSDSPSSNGRSHRSSAGLWHCLAARRNENGHLGPRVIAWALADWWEASPRLRSTVRIALPITVLVCAAGFWLIPRWYRHNTVRLAEKWMQSGKLSYAAEAIKSAIRSSPDNPDTWRVAAEFARRVGRWKAALDYSQRAARLDPTSTSLKLDLAADALVADALPEAKGALDSIPAATRDASGRAQRIAGEIALRETRLTDACNDFRASIRLEGPAANNEIPLGSTLLASTTPAERAQGVALLEKWVPSPVAGALALRPLLVDATARHDAADMKRYALALLHHPACLISDIPKCLLALSKSDEAAYQATLADLEKVHRSSPEKAALLIGWLNQIGRSDSALAFGQTLPPPVQTTPPVAPSLFEALRLSSDWSRLLEATESEHWPSDTDFMRSAYGLLAATRLGNSRARDRDWKDLREHCEITRAHALFIGDTLYVWGLQDRALDLLWIAAKDPKTERLALETLARHYQVTRDAEGQYQVFRRLYSEHPDDPAIANNFAFFAALAGHEGPLALDVARRNYERHRHSIAYTSTYAFVLAHQMHSALALELIKPLKGDLDRAPGLRYTYAVVLAEMGRKDEARKIAKGLDLGQLTKAEAHLLRQLLREDILRY